MKIIKLSGQKNRNLFTMGFYKCTRCSMLLLRSEFGESIRKDRTRAVTNWCKKCRSFEYYKGKYKDICVSCSRNRKLDNNGICSKCNQQQGIRECKVCGYLLPIFLSFYETKKVCKYCLKLP